MGKGKGRTPVGDVAAVARHGDAEVRSPGVRSSARNIGRRAQRERHAWHLSHAHHRSAAAMRRVVARPQQDVLRVDGKAPRVGGASSEHLRWCRRTARQRLEESAHGRAARLRKLGHGRGEQRETAGNGSDADDSSQQHGIAGGGAAASAGAAMGRPLSENASGTNVSRRDPGRARCRPRNRASRETALCR